MFFWDLSWRVCFPLMWGFASALVLLVLVSPVCMFSSFERVLFKTGWDSWEFSQSFLEPFMKTSGVLVLGLPLFLVTALRLEVLVRFASFVGFYRGISSASCKVWQFLAVHDLEMVEAPLTSPRQLGHQGRLQACKRELLQLPVLGDSVLEPSQHETNLKKKTFQKCQHGEQPK